MSCPRYEGFWSLWVGESEAAAFLTGAEIGLGSGSTRLAIARAVSGQRSEDLQCTEALGFGAMVP